MGVPTAFVATISQEWEMLATLWTVIVYVCPTWSCKVGPGFESILSALVPKPYESAYNVKGVPEGVGEGDGVEDGVGVAEAVGVGDGDVDGVGVTVGVGVGEGFSVDKESS